MQNNRFMVLTGHLGNYPLSDLVGILRHQRKTGRLLIEYSKGPASFFFQDGELIDVQLKELSGLQAVCVALAQPEAAFNFNPLIRPLRRSIERSMQRVVSDLIGCWDESALQVESIATVSEVENSDPGAPHESLGSPHALQGRRSEPLALPPGPLWGFGRRYLLFMAAAGLLMIGLSTVIAVTVGFTSARSSSDNARRKDTEAIQESTIKVEENALPTHVAGVKEIPKSNRLTQAAERRQESRVLPGKQGDKDQSDPSSGTSPGSAASTESSRLPADGAAKAQTVNVVMQIENGRVLRASIANHKPGMESYEALALRIARQRRYASKVSGEETVKVSVARAN